MSTKVVLVALLTGAGAAVAQPLAMWQPLGDCAADAGSLHDIRVGQMAGNFQAVSIEARHGVPVVSRVIVHYDEGERTAQVVDLGDRRIDRSHPRILIPLRACCHTIDRIDVEFGAQSDGEVAVSAE
jgi:hypothetical protein